MIDLLIDFSNCSYMPIVITAGIIVVKMKFNHFYLSFDGDDGDEPYLLFRDQNQS